MKRWQLFAQKLTQLYPLLHNFFCKLLIIKAGGAAGRIVDKKLLVLLRLFGLDAFSDNCLEELGVHLLGAFFDAFPYLALEIGTA